MPRRPVNADSATRDVIANANLSLGKRRVLRHRWRIKPGARWALVCQAAMVIAAMAGRWVRHVVAIS